MMRSESCKVGLMLSLVFLLLVLLLELMMMLLLSSLMEIGRERVNDATVATAICDRMLFFMRAMTTQQQRRLMKRRIRRAIRPDQQLLHAITQSLHDVWIGQIREVQRRRKSCHSTSSGLLLLLVMMMMMMTIVATRVPTRC